MIKFDEVAYKCPNESCKSSRDGLVQVSRDDLRKFMDDKMRVGPWKMVAASLIPLPLNLMFNTWPITIAIHASMIALSFALCRWLNRRIER